jgi:hypothetical protein
MGIRGRGSEDEVRLGARAGKTSTFLVDGLIGDLYHFLFYLILLFSTRDLGRRFGDDSNSLGGERKRG